MTQAMNIGGRTVFTREGAINVYRLFLKVCYGDLNNGTAHALAQVEDDMLRVGFTWDEIEAIETEFLEEGVQ